MSTRPRRFTSRAGFTLGELMVTSAVLSVLVVMAMSAFFAVTRADIIASAQADLDLDVRQLVERLRSDLWRTSTDEILVYPAGAGPHTAISFPILHMLNETNPVPRNADGTIKWDATVIYHLWDGPPAEVRRTTFSPRLNLDTAARLAQLKSTVDRGEGRSAPEHQNVHTRTMIVNLVDWRLNIQGPSFDGYAPSPGRRRAGFGSAILTDGMHDFTFRTIGRNSASTGYRVGIDWLSASPSGSVREGERQTVAAVSGGNLSNVLVTNGYWSGNYYLNFNGGAKGEFTLRMENDRWEESNLFHTSAFLDEGVQIVFDRSVSPHAFALQLTGNEVAWRASEQTGHGGTTLWDINQNNTAVRVLLRGADLLDDSGFITVSGTNAWFTFRNGATWRQFQIREPFVARSDPDARMNVMPGTRVPITFGGHNELVLDPLQAAESDPVPYMINKANSYLVGFIVDQPVSTTPFQWRGWVRSVHTPQSYFVRNADMNTHAAADWSAIAYPVNIVLALESVRVGYAPEGTYRSRIFDTHNEAPKYRTVAWTANSPGTSEVEVRVRVGADSDLAYAPAWEHAMIAMNGGPFILNGRYAQVQVRLRPGGNYADVTPALHDFTLRWAAAARSVDVSGMMATGPDHGIVEVLVDGRPLVQGLTADLSVYKDVVVGEGKTRRHEATAFAELVPRNTRGLVAPE